MSTFRRPSSRLPIVAAALAMTVIRGAPGPSASAENPAIAAKRRAERKNFSDAEIAEGFLKTASRNFIWPAASIASADMPDGCACSSTATTKGARRNWRKSWPTSPLASGISISPWPRRARRPRSRCGSFATATSIAPWHSSLEVSGRARSRSHSTRNSCPDSGRTRKYEIEHSDVILTVDDGDFLFLAHEELLQSLGPINDTSSLPWTMFNDKVSMAFSTSTTSTSSTCSTIRASSPA